jgi:hypothetical protein
MLGGSIFIVKELTALLEYTVEETALGGDRDS